MGGFREIGSRRAGIAAAVLLGALLSAAAAPADAVAILMPGAKGAVPEDFLIRNRDSFTAAGIRTVVATTAADAVAAARAEPAEAQVYIVGMSRGALQVAEAIAAGAPLDGAVFVSANYRGVIRKVGDPAKLPRTLSVHHADDACRNTPAKGARRFENWAAGKARLVLIESAGDARGGVCGAFGAHGYFQKDAEPIRAITGFIAGG